MRPDVLQMEVHVETGVMGVAVAVGGAVNEGVGLCSRLSYLSCDRLPAGTSNVRAAMTK